mgnify:CR=1 FL=1|jgi:hypothetical protein
MTVAIIIVLALAIIGMIWFAGWNEHIGGKILDCFFPCADLQKSDKVEIFINGKWNRTATVTACCQSYLTVYNAVRCPIDYRGTFYAIGEDANGNVMVYLADRRNYRFVKRAEAIRKICHIYDNYDLLTPADDGRTITDIFSGIKERKPEIIEEGLI